MSERGRSGWLSAFTRIDLNPKPLNEFKIRTSQGGFISLLAIIMIGYLIMSEIYYHLSMDVVDKMLVDGSRNRMIELTFDIEFQRIPCSALAVDTSNTAGVVEHDVHRNVKKEGLDAMGMLLGTGSVMDLAGEAWTDHLETPDPKTACGDCYGAGLTGECCDTCEQVQAAYKKRGWSLPSLHGVKQCQHAEIERILHEQSVEGCRVYGSVMVTKSDGKITFAPSKLLMTYLSAKDLLDRSIKILDISHVIHALHFGPPHPEMKSPLLGFQKLFPSSTRGSQQYFIKVVPTTYASLDGKIVDTNQFSVTEHFRQLQEGPGRNYPVVTVSYSFSPIMFQVEEYRRGYLMLLTNLCAIVGGIFTMFGVFDALIFSYFNRLLSMPPLSK